MFVQFCVLSGCDFLDSLPNMGIVVRFLCSSVGSRIRNL